MELVTIVQIAFAATAAVAALTLVAVAFDRSRRRVLVGLAVLVGVTAVAAWVAFGLRREAGIAAAAGGISVAFLTQLAAVKLRDLLRASRRVDDQLARAQGRINSMIAREADERMAELERTLVRARADSASILAEQERRMAEERRAAAADRSRTAADELGEALTAAQQQMEVIWLPLEDGSSIPIGLYKGGQFSAIHTDHLGTPRLITASAKAPIWQWPYSAFGNNKPTGPLQTVMVATATATSTQLQAVTPGVEFELGFPGQYRDRESYLAYNWWRYYQASQGRYDQFDPIRFKGGWNGFLYVGGSPLSATDPSGLVQHQSGRWIDCGKGCRIRIDWTLENDGKVRYHLHWECKKREGECGENGQPSHGGSWDDVPEHVKECARKAGFKGDPVAQGPRLPANAPKNFTPIPNTSSSNSSWSSASSPRYDPRTDTWNSNSASQGDAWGTVPITNLLIFFGL